MKSLCTLALLFGLTGSAEIKGQEKLDEIRKTGEGVQAHYLAPAVRLTVNEYDNDGELDPAALTVLSCSDAARVGDLVIWVDEQDRLHAGVVVVVFWPRGIKSE